MTRAGRVASGMTLELMKIPTYPNMMVSFHPLLLTT